MSKDRYRMVFMRMQAEEHFCRLDSTPCARLLWYELIAGEHTNIIPGLLKIGEAAFAETLRWPLEGFRRAFDQIATEGMAKADWQARLVWASGVFLDNAPANPDQIKSWKNAWIGLPKCALKDEAQVFIRNHLATRKPGFLEAFDGICEHRVPPPCTPTVSPHGVTGGVQHQEAASRKQEAGNQQQQAETILAKKLTARVEKRPTVSQGEAHATTAIAAPLAAAAESRAVEMQETLEALKAVGMPPSVKATAKEQPSLANAVLQHCKTRFADSRAKPIRNKPGYIVSCFRKPEEMGFEQRDGCWFEPPDEKKVQAQRNRQRADEAAKDREEKHAKEEKEMAIEGERIRRWDALPEAMKEKIRQLTRERFSLVRNSDPESFGFLSACRIVMEQLARDGKL